MPGTRAGGPRRGRLLVALALLVAVVAVAGWLAARGSGTRTSADGPAAAGAATSATVTPAAGTPGTPAPSAPSSGDAAATGSSSAPPPPASPGGTTPSSPSSSRRPVPVTVTYSAWDAGTSAVVVDAFAGVVESGGTCTLTLVTGGSTVTATSRAEPDASTTDCAEISVAGSRLAPGTWRGTLAYSSPRSTGTSSSFPVVVP
jgi:hypothetical protein